MLIFSFMTRRSKRPLLVTLPSLVPFPASALFFALQTKQTSGGTGPSDLARKVRLVSDQLALGIRSKRRPYLPQALPALLQTLLLDDLPMHGSRASSEDRLAEDDETAKAVGPTGGNPAADAPLSATAAREPLALALLHVVGEMPLRWHTAGDLDACAGGPSADIVMPSCNSAALSDPWFTNRLFRTFLRPAITLCCCRSELSMPIRLLRGMCTMQSPSFCSCAGHLCQVVC